LLLCKDIITNDEKVNKDSEKESSESAFNEVNSDLANVFLNTKVFLPLLKIKLRSSKGTMNV